MRTVLKTDLFEEGFGQDAVLDALADIYPVVVGMDISRVVVAASKARLSGVTHVVSDAYALPFKTAAFDLVVSVSTLDHLPPDLLPRALAELCRVLAAGGCAVLTLDSGHNPLHVFSNVFRRRLGPDLRGAVLHGRGGADGAGGPAGPGDRRDSGLPRAVPGELPGEACRAACGRRAHVGPSGRSSAPSKRSALCRRAF